jgi:hypothetical protein
MNEVYTDHEIKPNMKELSNWVFHYNSATNTWDATTRDNYTNLFSDRSNGVISSSRFETLVDLIYKAKGNINLIHKIAK